VVEVAAVVVEVEVEVEVVEVVAHGKKVVV
jgi:hypothetical protein